MTDTLEHTTARKPVRRRTWIAGAVVAALAVGVTAVLFSGGDYKPEFPVVKMTPTNHEVIYEVNGTGIAPVISFIVGENNLEQTALRQPMPWRTTIQLPVGPAGGFANVEVRSPGTGAGSLACRVFVDGVLVAEKASTDGLTSVSCAARIAPEYVK
ncbi:MmpS family transport accessory protein [Sporichthya sp.]|uniref:MmpS family transport accessory protein n=1 Tax=Sporichthya sp. TaxID=65475 RepID=UPI00179A1C23|nr:MmpS family transport accessory protein [Sporichthya sp.]MBA3742641.1 hypothetical protein [Sporichthya sp.]